MKNGGVIYRYERFFHPACMILHIEEFSGESVPNLDPQKDIDYYGSASRKHKAADLCGSCGEDLKGKTFGRARFSSRFAWEPICRTCMQGEFQQCPYCGTYVHKYRISTIVTGGEHVGLTSGKSLLCDFCADSYNDVETVKTQRTRLRKEKRAQEDYERVKRTLEERYVQED